MKTVSPFPDLWLTLARAFLPPLTRQAQTAFQDWLPGDLHDLCAPARIEAGDAIDAFKAAAAGRYPAEQLLIHYSRLFLTPPIAARLNVAACLQGSLNNQVMDAIEALLSKYGIVCNEGFHDTPDHLSSLLELMAVLETTDGAADDLRLLAGDILAPAVLRIRTTIAGVAPDSPYLHLLDILLVGLTPRFAEQGDRRPAARPAYNRDPSKGVWRKCPHCGQLIAREKELAIMARALRDQGLDSKHLDICPDCRDPFRRVNAA